MTLNKESQKKLEELRVREEEDLALILSQKYGIGYVNLKETPINTEVLRLLVEKEARDAEIVTYQKQNNEVSVAIRTPNSDTVKKILRNLEERGYKIIPHLATHKSLEYAWTRYKDLSFAVETAEGVLTISNEEVENLRLKLTSITKIPEELHSTPKLKRQFQITRMLEILVAGAMANNASDIHCEPREENVQIRYRLDGVLVDIATLERQSYFSILTRIKLLSGLKINITTSPQDGRFSIQLDKKEIEIRTSILPGGYGESIVMRLLDPKSIGVPLEDIGFNSKLLERILLEIEKPNGMILNTGPTGSGKTTTLYALLKKVLSPKIKILTIEDPIEYHLQGVVQTQTNKNYTFASGLRSALRQDPDIIMVGEIRDEEVASTAVHAALTGHLVFSTLHTNNAAGTFPRLIDIGVDASMVASSVNATLAQRLLRMLIPNKKKEVALKGKDKDFVDRVLEGIQDKSLIPQNTASAWVPDVPEGEIGYKGRIGVFECIFMTRDIENAIREKLTTHEIEDVAKKQGFLSMREDAVLKVLNGVTTLEEMRRVLGENPDM